MATPSSLSYGTVVGQFLVSASDGADIDTLPDAVPASGTVTLMPSAGVVLDYATPAAVIKKPVVCTLDSEGFIVGPSGTRGVKLIATDDPNVKPVGWTWVASYALVDDEGNALRSLITQPFFVPAGETTDLVVAMPIEESKGVFLSKGDKGDKGDNNVLTVGSVSLGTEPSVAITGDSPSQELSFVLPVNQLTIGTVEAGESAPTPSGGMFYRGTYGQYSSIDFEDGIIQPEWSFDRQPSIVDYVDSAGGTTKALTFAELNHNESSYIDIPLDIKAGSQVTVRYGMQTETNWDFFTIDVDADGTDEASLSGSKVAGAVASITDNDGATVIRFKYTKDYVGDLGYDNVRISKIFYQSPTDIGYSTGSVVDYKGRKYVAVVDNPTVVPDEINNVQWTLLGSGGAPTALAAITGFSNALNVVRTADNQIRLYGTIYSAAGYTGQVRVATLPLAYAPAYRQVVKVLTQSTSNAVEWDADSFLLEISPPLGGQLSAYDLTLRAGQTIKAATTYVIDVTFRPYNTY